MFSVKQSHVAPPPPQERCESRGLRCRHLGWWLRRHLCELMVWGLRQNWDSGFASRFTAFIWLATACNMKRVPHPRHIIAVMPSTPNLAEDMSLFCNSDSPVHDSVHVHQIDGSFILGTLCRQRRMVLAASQHLHFFSCPTEPSWPTGPACHHPTCSSL